MLPRRSFLLPIQFGPHAALPRTPSFPLYLKVAPVVCRGGGQAREQRHQQRCNRCVRGAEGALACTSVGRRHRESSAWCTLSTVQQTACSAEEGSWAGAELG